MLTASISVLLCKVIALPFPVYASFKALESEGKDDDTQWLVYWIIYSLFTFFEGFASLFLSWIPFYYELKLGILLLLQFPDFGLPNIIYERWVKPFFIKHEKDVDIAVKEAAKELRSTINSAVDKGLGENNMLGEVIKNQVIDKISGDDETKPEEQKIPEQKAFEDY